MTPAVMPDKRPGNLVFQGEHNMTIQKDFQKYLAQVRSYYRDVSGEQELPDCVDVTVYYDAGRTALQAAFAIYHKLNKTIS